MGRRPSTRLRLALTPAALLAFAMAVGGGCAGNGGSGILLAVDVETDLRPGLQFVRVETVATPSEGSPRTTRSPATESQDFLAGQRVAEFSDIAVDDYRVEVRLVDGSDGVVASRQVAVRIEADKLLRIVIDSQCVGVTCPGDGDPMGASECLGGRCVPPECIEPDDPACEPDAGCSDASDCTGFDSCAEPSCSDDGVCFGEANDARCGAEEYCDVRAGCRSRGMTEDGGGDASVGDGGMPIDSGTPCSDPCGDFERCADGTCESYPGCLSDAGCDAGTVCRHRFCIPEDVDVDGDGSPAGEDCDEMDTEIFGGAEDTCNGIDDDCSGTPDDAEPSVLCPDGGECLEGSCGCPGMSFDLDGDPDNGCECAAEPGLSEGLTCDTAIDVGSLADTGEMVTVTGNVLPDDRSVWYRFQATDTADTACDNLYVRALLTTNPADRFELEVHRGGCGSTLTPADTTCTDVTWATDFRATIDGRLSGQCPCTAPGATRMPDVSVCEDDSATYHVKVSRAPGSEVTCDGYELELSNGLYDTM